MDGERPSVEIPRAEWAVVADLCLSALSHWDAWCPDDGRLAAGLAAIRAYLRTPVGSSPAVTVLARAAAAIAEAYAMVDEAVDQPEDEGTWAAWNVARTVYVLVGALIHPPYGGQRALFCYTLESARHLQPPRDHAGAYYRRVENAPTRCAEQI